MQPLLEILPSSRTAASMACRETYLALGVPIASAAESIRIMKDLTSSLVIDPEGESIVEDVQYADYTRIDSEIASYFDLVIQALS